MKRELNVLEEVLLEEYDRVLRRIKTMENEVSILPKGSISRKVINGCDAFYRCYRDGDKVKTIHIKKSDLENMTRKIEQRKHYENIIRESKAIKKQLEKSLGKKLLNEYRSRRGVEKEI